MLLTRQNPLGGRRLTTFPISEDEQGNVGFKLGYCSHGEPIICRIGEAREIAEQFVGGINEYYKFMGRVREKAKPKEPLTVRIAKFLLKGNKKYAEQFSELEEDFKES